MKALRLLAVSVCLFVSVVANAQQYDAKLREFEAFAQQQMKSANIPGLSVAVMKDDFIWSKGFGLADVENNVPATATSSYRLASVTKPMTAVAVLKLVEEGKIDLDAEVQKYVPSFPKKQWPITIRQLLTHTGGVSHYKDVAAESHFKEPKNTVESLAVFRDFDLVAEPGTRWEYSSYGYVLLGAVIEGATGKPYAEVMREKVWEPLGMTSTRMDDMRVVIPNRVRGYEVNGGKLRNAEYVDVTSRFSAGGTRSTVVDMIAFVRGVAAGKVLSPEMLDRMWTQVRTKDGVATRWGLGWEVQPVAGRFRVHHDGAQPETSTYLVYIPREHFAIALAANLERADLNPFANQLASLFLGDEWGQRPLIRGTQQEQTAGRSIVRAFNSGLAYYDRYGKAAAANQRELADAFRALNATLDGKEPTREQAIAVGSHIAQTLAARGVDKYHHDGAFAFFADYNGSPKLNPALAKLIAQWRTDWATTSKITDAATLAKEAASLTNASVIPDFVGELVGATQRAAMRGNIPEALRLAKLAAALYPDADAPNGSLGVLLILTGDVAGGEAAIRKSAAINPDGYVGAANILRVAEFLANGPARPAAIKILTLAAEIHPNDAAIAKALNALRSTSGG